MRTAGRSRRRSAAPPAPGAVRLYGVGLRRTAVPQGPDDQAVNVICVPPSGSAATGVERALTGGLTPATRTVLNCGIPQGETAVWARSPPRYPLPC
ncbi:hypothetical protein [Nonomuraea sp. NPDC049709]|uniref:hypothetical protein n=1 Tax=Nonomuraea sp. NPDC049709 TaxID=3154736 RepID=UPI00342808EA